VRTLFVPFPPHCSLPPPSHPPPPNISNKIMSLEAGWSVSLICYLYSFCLSTLDIKTVSKEWRIENQHSQFISLLIVKSYYR
jgi:hypothetical protein